MRCICISNMLTWQMVVADIRAGRGVKKKRKKQNRGKKKKKDDVNQRDAVCTHVHGGWENLTLTNPILNSPAPCRLILCTYVG